MRLAQLAPFLEEVALNVEAHRHSAFLDAGDRGLKRVPAALEVVVGAVVAGAAVDAAVLAAVAPVEDVHVLHPSEVLRGLVERALEVELSGLPIVQPVEPVQKTLPEVEDLAVPPLARGQGLVPCLDPLDVRVERVVPVAAGQPHDGPRGRQPASGRDLLRWVLEPHHHALVVLLEKVIAHDPDEVLRAEVHARSRGRVERGHELKREHAPVPAAGEHGPIVEHAASPRVHVVVVLQAVAKHQAAQLWADQTQLVHLAAEVLHRRVERDLVLCQRLHAQVEPHARLLLCFVRNGRVPRGSAGDQHKGIAGNLLTVHAHFVQRFARPALEWTAAVQDVAQAQQPRQRGEL